MLGDKCIYDRKWICFRWEVCVYDDLTNCLKTNIHSLIRKQEHMKARMMTKHTEASIKWRGQAFYFKKKCRQMEAYMLENDLKPPSTRDLVTLITIAGGKEGGEDERVCGVNKKERGKSNPPIQAV